MISYPTGKIYIGKDSVGSFRYFGSPDISVVNEDFLKLPKQAQKSIVYVKKSCGKVKLQLKKNYQNRNCIS